MGLFVGVELVEGLPGDPERVGDVDYNPGLNRLTTRDMYNGVLADLNLSVDPFNSNRYAFAGGNPINRIELDGHAFIEFTEAYRRDIDAGADPAKAGLCMNGTTYACSGAVSLVAILG